MVFIRFLLFLKYKISHGIFAGARHIFLLLKEDAVMRENTREFVTINLALFTVLLLLAVFSLGGNGAVQVFTGKSDSHL